MSNRPPDEPSSSPDATRPDEPSILSADLSTKALAAAEASAKEEVPQGRTKAGAASSDPKQLDFRPSTKGAPRAASPDFRPSDLRPSTKGARGAVAAFRGDLRASLPLHPLEHALVWIAALNVCSLPWMLGGMRPWAQFIALGLSFIAFGISLLPRRYTQRLVHGEAYSLYPWRKLIHWPVWWIGLVFFSYLLIQALNPAYGFVQNPNSWSMVPIDHIAWLPSSMTTPFTMMNSWRQMIIWGAPFLLTCALWIGITRRRSLILLASSVVINATALAVLGIAQRGTGAKRIFWTLEDSEWRGQFFASFIYKNHAGSYFAIATVLSLAMAVFYHKQAKVNQRRSSPAPLFIMLGLVSGVAVLLSYSRAALALTAGFVFLFTVVALARANWQSTLAKLSAVLLALVIVGATIMVSQSKLVDSQRIQDRFQDLTNRTDVDFSFRSRQLAWTAGLEMFSDQPVYGWGAGDFRFLFPKYQTKYPEITYQLRNKIHEFMFWEHIHNDYLQISIEIGLLGIGLILAGLIVLGRGFYSLGGFRQTTTLAFVSVPAITLIHASVDFPLQNPAILVTFSGLLTLSLVFPRFEARTQSKAKLPA